MFNLKILFDQAHGESWAASLDKAKQINPNHPKNSSYQQALDVINAHGCDVIVNYDHQISQELLDDIDVLFIIHPCEEKWEKQLGAALYLPSMK